MGQNGGARAGLEEAEDLAETCMAGLRRRRRRQAGDPLGFRGGAIGGWTGGASVMESARGDGAGAVLAGGEAGVARPATRRGRWEPEREEREGGVMCGGC